MYLHILADGMVIIHFAEMEREMIMSIGRSVQDTANELETIIREKGLDDAFDLMDKIYDASVLVHPMKRV